MQTHELAVHPARPPHAVWRVTARLTPAGPHWLQLRWRIEGAGRIVTPPLAGSRRADGLWRATCFELFVAPADGTTAYREFNFSPSEAWAAYDFSGYREGMAEAPMPRAPVVAWRSGRSGLALFDAAIPRVALPATPLRYALTAVIEEEGGAFSYWAMAHGGAAPDFHDAACFAGRLEAPVSP